MKVLVSGGAGFIGSHVCDVLLSRGYKVLCIDNLSKGSLDNIKHNLNNSRFEFKKIDILDREMLFSASSGMDVIIHLVAFKIPRYSSSIHTLLLNSQGTINILDLARINNTKVLIGSTSDVYGKSADFPFREDGDLVLGPSTSRRWAYAASKLFDEHLAYAFEDEYGLKVAILRFFGTYGERQYLNWWGGPQGVFLEAIFNNEPMEIHGDGKQARCFIYIKDAAEAIVRALESEKAVGEIINIGTQEEISILDLAKLMHQLSGVPHKFQIKYIPYSLFSKNYEDVMRRIPSIKKMENLLGYKPRIELREGLTSLIEWYKGKKKGN